MELNLPKVEQPQSDLTAQADLQKKVEPNQWTSPNHQDDSMAGTLAYDAKLAINGGNSMIGGGINVAAGHYSGTIGVLRAASDLAAKARMDQTVDPAWQATMKQQGFQQRIAPDIPFQQWRDVLADSPNQEVFADKLDALRTYNRTQAALAVNPVAQKISTGVGLGEMIATAELGGAVGAGAKAAGLSMAPRILVAGAADAGIATAGDMLNAGHTGEGVDETDFVNNAVTNFALGGVMDGAQIHAGGALKDKAIQVRDGIKRRLTGEAPPGEKVTQGETPLAKPSESPSAERPGTPPEVGPAEPVAVAPVEAPVESPFVTPGSSAVPGASVDGAYSEGTAIKERMRRRYADSLRTVADDGQVDMFGALKDPKSMPLPEDAPLESIPLLKREVPAAQAPQALDATADALNEVATPTAHAGQAELALHSWAATPAKDVASQMTDAMSAAKLKASLTDTVAQAQDYVRTLPEGLEGMVKNMEMESAWETHMGVQAKDNGWLSDGSPQKVASQLLLQKMKNAYGELTEQAGKSQAFKKRNNKLLKQLKSTIDEHEGALANLDKPRLVDVTGEKPVRDGARGEAHASLANAKPTYTLNGSTYLPKFDSPVDKALFIVGQGKRAFADAEHMEYLRKLFPQLSDDEIRAFGKDVNDFAVRSNAEMVPAAERPKFKEKADLRVGEYWRDNVPHGQAEPGIVRTEVELEKHHQGPQEAAPVKGYSAEEADWTEYDKDGNKLKELSPRFKETLTRERLEGKSLEQFKDFIREEGGGKLTADEVHDQGFREWAQAHDRLGRGGLAKEFSSAEVKQMIEDNRAPKGKSRKAMTGEGEMTQVPVEAQPKKISKKVKKAALAAAGATAIGAAATNANASSGGGGSGVGAVVEGALGAAALIASRGKGLHDIKALEKAVMESERAEKLAKDSFHSVRDDASKGAAHEAYMNAKAETAKRTAAVDKAKEENAQVDSLSAWHSGGYKKQGFLKPDAATPDGAIMVPETGKVAMAHLTIPLPFVHKNPKVRVGWTSADLAGTSESNTVRAAGDMFFSNAVGKAAGSPRRFLGNVGVGSQLVNATADVLQRARAEAATGAMSLRANQAFDQWLKEEKGLKLGIKQQFDIGLAREFNRDLADAMRGVSSASPAAQAAAKDIQRGVAQFHGELQDLASRLGVDPESGSLLAKAAAIEPSSIYLTRVWSREARTRVLAEVGRDGVDKILAKSMHDANPELTLEEAQVQGKALHNALDSFDNGKHLSMSMIDRQSLRLKMIQEGVPSHQVDMALDAVLPHEDFGRSPGQMQERINLNEQMDPLTFDKVDGSGQVQYSVRDLFDNNPVHLVGQWYHVMSGVRATAEAGERFGVDLTSNRAWELMKSQMRAEGAEEKAVKLLDAGREHILGIGTSNDIFGHEDPVGSALRKMMTVRYGKYFGFAQMAELGNQLPNLTLKRLGKSMPGVKDLIASFKSGAPAEGLARDLASMIGMGYEHVAPLLKNAVEDGTAAGFTRGVDLVLHKSMAANGFYNTLDGINHLVTNAALYKLADAAKGTYKVPEGQWKHWAVQGIDKAMFERIQPLLNKHVKWDEHDVMTGIDGRGLELDRSDPEASRQLLAFLYNVKKDAGSEARGIGQQIPFMTREVGRFLMQFQNVAIACHQRFRRDLLNFDGRVAARWTSSFMMALAVQASRAYLTTMGLSDRDREKAMDPRVLLTTALRNSSFSGIGTNVLSGVSYLTPWGDPMAGNTTSGRASPNVPPVLDAGPSFLNAVHSVVTDLADDKKHLTAKDAGTMFSQVNPFVAAQVPFQVLMGTLLPQEQLKPRRH